MCRWIVCDRSVADMLTPSVHELTPPPSPAIASTVALIRAVAAAEHFRQTGQLPSWTNERTFA